MGCCGDCCVPPKESREPIRYDPDFSGPTHNRSCTDIIWLIIFLVFLGGWAFVGYYGIKNGDVQRLLAPIDSKGRHCGMDSGVQNKPYLVFFDITRCLSPGIPITGCPTTQVCVEQCPQETVQFKSLNPAAFEQVRSKMICSDEVNIQTMTYTQAIENIEKELCAPYVLKSQSVLQRCFMNVTEVAALEDVVTMGLSEASISQKINHLISFEQLSSEIVNDLVSSRWYLLGALVVVVLLCFLYVLLLRWVVAPVVWTSIVGLAALFAFSLYLCYKNYKYYVENPVSMYQTYNVKGYTQSIFAKHETWMVLLVALAIILVVYVLIIIFLRRRITIAIALIREGSKAVGAVKSTVFFPLFPWVLQCAVIVYGVVVLMFLLSIGEPAFRVVNFANDTCVCTGKYTADYAPCDPVEFMVSCHDQSYPLQSCRLATCHFVGFDNPGGQIYVMHFVNLLGFFWVMFFISGVSDMMLASTFSTWYWTFDKSHNLPFFTLTAGIWRTLRYHLGTVAFGSLIIAIVRVIRVILEYIDHKVKKYDNMVTRCVLCCCKCLFACLESFLKFINKNAYIMCAVHGKNFCTSARDAFSLLMRNIVRVVVLDKVMDLIFFLSKLLISIGVGFAVYYLLEWQVVYEVTKGNRLHYNFVPAIILSVATYLISTIFFNVYAMAVDTLFLCFLEDCERNDGSPEKRYFMSKNLMKILGKRNKRE